MHNEFYEPDAYLHVRSLTFRVPLGPWLTKREAAVLLGVSESTIDRLRRSGKLKTHIIRSTTCRRFRRDEVENLRDE